MKSLDLTGQRFGKLVVLGIDEDNKYNSSHKIQWKCQCDCGQICYKTTDSLKKPVKAANTQKACSKSCGSSIPIGTRFGRLVVLENIFEANTQTKSKCQCDCGNIIITASYRLKNGATKSCGCYKNDRMAEIGKQTPSVNLTGQRFGKLTAIKPTDKRQNKSIVWICKCDCGNLHLASVNNLKGGYVSRCSHCKIISKGEEKITKLLTDSNITFTTQQTFEDCRFPETNALLKFDFYVNNQYLIEFDGLQHFYSSEKGWNTKEKLEYIQARDNYKNQWCKANNVPLIRIPFSHLEFLDIKDLLLKSSKFII